MKSASVDYTNRISTHHHHHQHHHHQKQHVELTISVHFGSEGRHRHTGGVVVPLPHTLVVLSGRVGISGVPQTTPTTDAKTSQICLLGLVSSIAVVRRGRGVLLWLLLVGVVVVVVLIVYVVVGLPGPARLGRQTLLTQVVPVVGHHVYHVLERSVPQLGPFDVLHGERHVLLVLQECRGRGGAAAAALDHVHQLIQEGSVFAVAEPGPAVVGPKRRQVEVLDDAGCDPPGAVDVHSAKDPTDSRLLHHHGPVGVVSGIDQQQTHHCLVHRYLPLIGVDLKRPARKPGAGVMQEIHEFVEVEVSVVCGAPDGCERLHGGLPLPHTQRLTTSTVVPSHGLL
mmetsp:Transcript_46953/g.117061  ORF Transcript_46953/g.117061 Transcript_46953/m.117061 type:complete len:340 (-) Transcript_46953:900-1919(-)